MKISFAFILLLLTGSCLISFAFYQGKWIAPKAADNINNPLHDNAAATLEGKKIYTQMCVVCHGSKGKGDGVAGAALKPRPSNLSSASVQAQTDGALFWKLSTGRAPMASYKELLNENQRWAVVNYIRKLK